MKLVFAFIASFILFFQTPNLETIRSAYPKASTSKSAAKSFSALMEKSNATDAVTKAYKSAAKIIEAKFETGPSRKSMITAGIKGLEAAINANPGNVELRVIRMSIQENLPKIVGYNAKLKEDKGVILRNYNAQNSVLKQYIRQFSAASKTMTAAEKASLK